MRAMTFASAFFLSFSFSVNSQQLARSVGEPVKVEYEVLTSSSTLPFPGGLPGKDGKSPQTTATFEKVAIKLKNQEQFRVKCDAHFAGYRGTISGYQITNETVSTLVSAGDQATIQQPPNMLVSSVNDIEVKCYKFAF